MRALLLASAMTLAPCLTLADPQCVLPEPKHIQATDTIGQPPAVVLPLPSPSAVRPAEPSVAPAHPSPSTSRSSALDHVMGAGAQLTEAGISHGLRTVIARNDSQFIRMHVSPDGQALVAGLMAELSPADLLAMAPEQVTELGSLHNLRGLFVRNANHFQVFYVTPDGERVIPGAMFDAQGKNLTQAQITSIPGAIPTVTIGDASQQPGVSAQASTVSLLQAAAATTFGTVGSLSAPRLWMFVDPLCAWSKRAMDQLRPYVTNGRIALAVIPVPVLDHEDQGRSTLAAKAMLSLPQDTMVAAWSDSKLPEQGQPAADQRLADNMAVAAAIGLRGTPTLMWRKADGTEGCNRRRQNPSVK